MRPRADILVAFLVDGFEFRVGFQFDVDVGPTAVNEGGHNIFRVLPKASRIGHEDGRYCSATVGRTGDYGVGSDYQPMMDIGTTHEFHQVHRDPASDLLQAQRRFSKGFERAAGEEVRAHALGREESLVELM